MTIRSLFFALAAIIIGAVSVAADAVEPTLTASEIAGALDQIRGSISKRYPIEETADTIVAALKKAEHAGQFDTPLDDEAFAQAVTDVLWHAANDLHLKLYTGEKSAKRYGKMKRRMRRVRVDGPSVQGDAPGAGRRESPMGETAVTARMVDTTTGLITITSPIFSEPKKFEKILASVTHADQLILDLRKVPGGTMQGVQQFLSLFFGEPTHILSNITRDAPEPTEVWTVATGTGRVLADTPLYVLTGAHTASGAEAVSFGLKNTGRATLIGQKTAGAGNAGSLMTIGSRFQLFLPFAQTIDPETGEAWEATGVTPHLTVPEDDALKAALRHIESGDV